jgi:tRNA(Ile)-lysidine synthase
VARPAEPELLGRCRFPPPGTALVCGVSGGADSLALLVLAVAAECVVTAVHVDHGLRPGSGDEADLVRSVAAGLGAAFRAERVQVDAGPNLEARARRARHRALGPDCALGHTADDQAETILVNLLRGAGLDGLSGMRPGPRHPILALRRRETEALCARHGLVPFADPGNADPAFLRNRVRHEVLPLLADLADRDVVPVMGRQADLLRSVADHLRQEARALDPTDVADLGAAPEVVVRVALREWLRPTDPDRHPPDAATVDRVLDVVAGRVRATQVGGGWKVARTAGRLRLERTDGVPPVG